MALKLLSHAEQVASHLRSELLGGRWNETMPGVLALEAEFGVNRTTINIALNQLEQEGLLVGQGPGRRRRIVMPKDHVSAMQRVKILLYEESDRLLDSLLELRHQLQEAGHTADFSDNTLLDLGMDVKRVARFVNKTGADAWVVVAGSREVLEWFAARPEPVFAYFGRLRQVRIAGAGPDKVPALRASLRRLCALGHRRIVLLTREEHRKPLPGFVERSFLEELEAQGIAPGPYNLPDWEEDRASFHRCLDSLFRHTPPTALITDRASLFVAAQQHLARSGFLAPEHVSLVCTESAPLFEWCDPSIAHFRWDSRPMVRRIARWADNVARGKDDRRKNLFAAEFIEGGTIGPAPKET